MMVDTFVVKLEDVFIRILMNISIYNKVPIFRTTYGITNKLNVVPHTVDIAKRETQRMTATTED